MDERQEIEEQTENQATPESVTPEPAAPAEAEMPMLAGSAAQRLTQQILSRLSSPFATPSASPVRPTALWRQVGRRLGIVPAEEARPRPGAIRPITQIVT